MIIQFEEKRIANSVFNAIKKEVNCTPIKKDGKFCIEVDAETEEQKAFVKGVMAVAYLFDF